MILIAFSDYYIFSSPKNIFEKKKKEPVSVNNNFKLLSLFLKGLFFSRSASLCRHVLLLRVLFVILDLIKI